MRLMTSFQIPDWEVNTNDISIYMQFNPTPKATKHIVPVPQTPKHPLRNPNHPSEHNQ